MKEKVIWAAIGGLIVLIAYPQISKLPVISRIPQV